MADGSRDFVCKTITEMTSGAWGAFCELLRQRGYKIVPPPEPTEEQKAAEKAAVAKNQKEVAARQVAEAKADKEAGSPKAAEAKAEKEATAKADKEAAAAKKEIESMSKDEKEMLSDFEKRGNVK